MRQGNEARRRSTDSPASTYHPVLPSPDSSLILSDAARVTGINPDTICQWEDDEHLFASQRTRTDQRRYSAETIQRLLTIRKFVEQGLPMPHIALFMDEMAHATARARRATQHPLATTQHFFAVLNQVDRQLFTQRVALSQDPTSTPNDTLVVIRRELEIIQPTFAAHRLIFWLRLPDGSWPATESPLNVRQQRTYANHATRACKDGKTITRKLSGDQLLAIAPVHLDDQHQSVLMMVRSAHQMVDAVEQAALEFIAQRLTHFYYAMQSWMRERLESRFMRQLLDVLPQPIVMRDAKGNVVFFNESAEAIAENVSAIRAARENGLPLPDPRWDSASIDGNPLSDDEVPSRQALSTGEIIRDVPLTVKTTEAVTDEKDALWPGLATAVPLFDDDGALVYSATLLQDMTTPNKIQHLKDNVLNRVQHQIRNGLTATRGYAQIIDRMCQQELTKGEQTHLPKMLNTLTEHAKVITEQTFSMERWAYELRDLEKQVMGKPETCSLTHLVKESIHEMRKLHPNYHFTFEVDASDTELAGQWVPSDIRFIIDNLLGNAVKYSPAQSAINVFLSLSSVEDQPAAQMIVRDQGYGIPPEAYKTVFDKGVRLGHKDADGNVIPGTGEGLAYCLLYCLRYGGLIFPKPSKTGPGTEFWVKLQLEP